VANKYELHPEQLANLRIGAALKASQARETRQRVAVLHSRGHGAADIVLLTGISRATVYRWLATLRDPLLL
jgi:Fe2+ or Zn2+ uptake regulation protein